MMALRVRIPRKNRGRWKILSKNKSQMRITKSLTLMFHLRSQNLKGIWRHKFIRHLIRYCQKISKISLLRKNMMGRKMFYSFISWNKMKMRRMNNYKVKFLKLFFMFSESFSGEQYNAWNYVLINLFR